MPVIRKEKPSASPQHREFVNTLVEELARNQPTGPADAPTIVEDYEAGNYLHVTVLWDAWRDVGHEERGRIIMEAYERQRPEVVSEITMALGLTHVESERLGIKL